MAIDIGPIAKPQIRLVGDIVGSDGWILPYTSTRVDHAIATPPTSTTDILGVTQLDKEDILTYNGSVRVIITGQTSDKPVYVRQGSTGALDTNQFEGSINLGIKSVNKVAETYFTYNGRDPVRTKAYLYNFKDWDDFVPEIEGDPSSPSNVTELGFVLRNSPTGNNLVTIKAKTYLRGNESRIAVVTFKIAQKTDDKEFFQPPR